MQSARDGDTDISLARVLVESLAHRGAAGPGSRSYLGLGESVPGEQLELEELSLYVFINRISEVLRTRVRSHKVLSFIQYVVSPKYHQWLSAGHGRSELP